MQAYAAHMEAAHGQGWHLSMQLGSCRFVLYGLPAPGARPDMRLGKVQVALKEHCSKSPRELPTGGTAVSSCNVTQYLPILGMRRPSNRCKAEFTVYAAAYTGNVPGQQWAAGSCIWAFENWIAD